MKFLFLLLTIIPLLIACGNESDSGFSIAPIEFKQREYIYVGPPTIIENTDLPPIDEERLRKIQEQDTNRQLAQVINKIPAGTVYGESAHNDVPWYVPLEWHGKYRECLSNPERFNLDYWIRSVNWNIDEAHYVARHEGGNDLCQFNTTGSGACGWFQLLTCPPAGLTPESQISNAYAKWIDGGGSFERHWYQWWR